MLTSPHLRFNSAYFTFIFYKHGQKYSVKPEILIISDLLVILNPYHKLVIANREVKQQTFSVPPLTYSILTF